MLLLVTAMVMTVKSNCKLFAFSVEWTVVCRRLLTIMLVHSLMMPVLLEHRKWYQCCVSSPSMTTMMMVVLWVKCLPGVTPLFWPLVAFVSFVASSCITGVHVAGRSNDAADAGVFVSVVVLELFCSRESAKNRWNTKSATLARIVLDDGS